MTEGDSGHQEGPDEEACRAKVVAGDGASPGRTTGTRVATSAFRGVCWHRKSRRWQSAINSSGRHVYLGSFDSEEEAARMFDKVAIRVRGMKAKLNFPYEDYLGPDGQLLTDPKLEQLVNEARKALLEKQRWQVADDDDARADGGGSGGGSNKRRRLGAPTAAGVGLPQRGCVDPFPGKDLGPLPHQHPHEPRGGLMPGPAFGFGLGLGADAGLYGAAGGDADALGRMTGMAGGLEGPISNLPEGLMDPALRSLLALQQPEGPRALLPPQKQEGTGMLLQPGFVGGGGGGSVTAAAALGALRATGLRDLHDGDMADAVAAAAATAGHVGGRLLDLAGMAGGGGGGGSERGMGPADHVRARGAHGLGLRLDGADACGMMQQQGQPPLLPPPPPQHQQQQLARQLIPGLPGPRRLNVLEGVTLTAAAAVVAAGNPRLDVSAGLAAGQYSAPKASGGGGGGAAADASELDGFCLDLRKGPAAGGGSRADHRLGSPVEAAATAVAADGAPFLRLGYAAPEAAAATLGTVHQSRRLMGGATAEPPAASPQRAGSDLDLASLIGRFLAGVRCHLPAGAEIESLIPCADGSLLGYIFVRVLGGPGAPAAPAPAQQMGCSSSGSSGDRGGGRGAGRDDRGPDGDGAGGGASCEAPRELGPAAGHHPRGRSDRSSGSGSSGAPPEDIPGGVGGGSAGAAAGPDANGRPVTAAGIFFRGTYRDLGAYSTAQDAIQACKACMTVVLELKEALMAEAVAEALSRRGGGGGAAIAAPAPPPPLPPQPPPSWGREEEGADEAEAGAHRPAAAACLWRQLPLPVGPWPPPQGPPPHPHQPASERLQQQQGQQQGQLLLSSQEPLAAVEDQQRASSALEQLQQLVRQLARQQHGEVQPRQGQRQGQQPQATPGAAPGAAAAAQLGPHAAGALWHRRPLADTCGQRNDHDDEEEPHKSCESSQADGARLWQPQARPRPLHPPLTSTVRVAAYEGLGRPPKPEETEQKVSAQHEQEQQQQPGGARQPPAQAPPDVLGPAAEPRVAARAPASPPQALEALAQVVARLLSGPNPRDSAQVRRSPPQEQRPEQTPPPSQQHQQQQQLRQILRQGSGYEHSRPPPPPHPQQQQQRQGKQQPVFTSPPVLAEPGHRAALQLHALLNLQQQRLTAQASNCDHGAGAGFAGSWRLGFGACDIGGGGAASGAGGVLQALLANFSGVAALAGGNPDLLAAAAATMAAKAAAATAAADNDDATGRCARNPSGSCDSTDDAPPPLPPPGLGRRQPPPPPSPGTGRAGHSNASSSDVRAMKGPAWEGRSCGGGGAITTPDGDGSGGDAVAWQRREDSRLTWSRGPGAASLSAAAATAAAAAVARVAAPPLRAEADGARTGLYGGGHGQRPISRQPFHRHSSFHSQYSQYDNGHADVSESYGLGELLSRR